MRKLKLFLTLLMLMYIGVTQMWAIDYELVYTLDGSQTGGSSGYATESDITQDEIAWKVMGNTTMNPWRIGGKNLSNEGRTIYNTTAIAANVEKIELSHGAASSVTVNSMKVEVASDAAFSNIVSTLTPTFVASNTVTVNRPSAVDWTGKYYRITYYVTIGSSNKYIAFNNAKFYKEYVAPASPTIAAGEDAIDFGEKNIYFDVNKTGSVDIAVTGASLTGDISAGLSGANADNFSLSASSFTQEGGSVDATLTVSYSINATGSYAANLTLSSDGATSVVIPITLSAISENVVVDEITRETTGITGTSYTAWSGKKILSDAVYSGGSAGGNNSIQIRQDNNKKDAGIYTTASGGTLKKVVVDWNSNTSSGRILNVYGKNTAYTALTDLYDTNKQGTLLGTIVCGTSTELVVTENYKYVGIRATNSMYLNKVSITWAPAEKYAIEFAAPEGGTLVINDGTQDINTGAQFHEGDELTVTATPDGENHYIGGTIAVKKTSDDSDVTSDVLDGNTLTVPDYAITVSAAFTPTYAINIVADGGSVALDYTAGGAAEGYAIAGTEIMATVTADGSHLFKELALSDNVTVKDIDDNVAMFTMPEGAVTITATFDDKPCAKLATPANAAVSNLAYPYNAAVLNWDDVANADAYEVTIKKAGVVVESDVVEENAYTFSTTLLANTTYIYEIVATSENAAAYCPSDAASAEFATADYPTVTVIYSENGETNNARTAAATATKILTPFALPMEATACSQTFVGWTTKADFEDGDESETTYYEAGAEFTIESNAAVTLYAVYADVEGIESSIELTANTANMPSSYGAANTFTEYTLAGLKYQIQQMYKSGGRLQWRAGGNSSGTGTIYNSDKINNIQSIVLKYNSSDTGKNFGLKVGSSTNPTNGTAITQSLNESTGTFDCSAGAYDYFVLTNGSGAGYLDKLTINYISSYTKSNYTISCADLLDAPTFSLAPAVAPVDGKYQQAINVKIEATEGTIYYTINGADPTNESTPYENPIALSESGTYVIKAIAIGTNSQSAVATATYVLNIPLSTMDAIFAKATAVGSTATDVTIAFNNWVVSGVNGNQAFVTDGTKGFVIYGSSHGFALNDKISGTVDCKLQLYSGFAEVTTLTVSNPKLTVTHDGEVTPVEANVADLNGAYTGALITLNNIQFDGTDLVDASDNKITPYTTFYDEAVSSLVENHVYNLTGIYIQYNAKKEIAPRAAADIVDATEYVKVSFDANANDATGDLPEDVTGLIAGHNSYTIPTEKPLSREAYLQIGWNTDKDAEVALEGNLTNITANTTLYAIWTAKATCAIKFYDRGNEYASKSPYQGVEYTIDVDDPEAPSGYTFAGWSASQINSEATSAELVTTITPASATMSLYAVYTRSEGETVIVYNKVTSTPDDWAGKYLIVNEEAGKAFDGSLETLDAVSDVIAVTINEGVIAGSAEVNAAVFTVAAATSNYSIRSASGFYIGQTANSNGLLSSTTNVYTNTLAISGGNAVITSSGNPTLRYNKASDQNRFRYYKSGQQPVQLYKQNVTLPTVYYTTAPVNRYTVSFNLAEDEQGSFSDISVVQGNDATLPAEVPTKLHNTFAGWTDGEHVYQASATIEDVMANIVLSATWTENAHATVSYNLNGAEGEIASEEVYEGETYTLPAAPAYGTNIFGGWSDGTKVWAAKAEVTMSTVAPVTYTAQWTVVPEFNAGYWFKVTDASTLAAGQFVMIVAEDADYALGATQNTSNRSADAISKIANPAAAYYATAPAILLLQNGLEEGQFGLYVTNGTKGYLYASGTGNNNHMKTKAAMDDASASWTIAINNGTTTVEANSNNRNKLLYNTSKLFSCYGSTGSTIKNVAIYRYEESNKLQVSYAGKGTEHVQGALVDAGGSVTLAAAPAAPEAEDVTYTFSKWMLDGVEYDPAAEIENITENKVVYAKWNVETKEAATEITIPVEDVVASDIHVKENQTVTVEVTEDVTLGNLDLENGAILEFDVTPGATVEANDLILRSSSADRDQHQGMSSQAPVMPVVNGILALEIQLRPDEMTAENSSLWYCIAAPFDVDINSGFEWVHPNGSRTPMVHNVDFQIFAYDGARRATGASGWQRIGGTMKAGVAHFIGFDNERTNQNTIRLTAKSNTVAPATEIALGSYPGAADYQNWNGVANPTMQYIGIDKDIVAFDYGIQDYNTYANTAYNYFVGSPFFIQQEGGSIVVDHTDRGGAIHAPKRVADKLEYCVRINAAGAKSFESQMYVRASETASSEYEEGHDLASQSSTTPKYGARIWSENYNVRLGIEEAPLNNGNATYVLGIATPSAGEYTISVAAPKENADLYLTYNGSIIWNLSEGAYTVELPKGMTTGYGLVLNAKTPMTPTGIDTVDGEKAGVQKVVINNNVYILRNKQMYDVVGKIVK